MKTMSNKLLPDVANDLLKTEQINPEISLDGIHPDLINGLLEVKRNFSEFPNSSKELMEFVKFCRNASAKDIRQIHDRARDLIANYKEYCNKSCKKENATCKKSLQVSRSDFETLEKAYHNALDAYHDVAEQLEELKARSRQ